ncbi:MAG TPA: hypothetical protein VL043_12365 [Protaetiibacter sp.]|nr:hypothetical protein [Protaetiibacter sp.]
MSTVTQAELRSTAAGVLHDEARRLLELSHAARTVPKRAHLLKAARQLNLVGESVQLGSKTIDEAQAWIDAGRLFIAEQEAVTGGAKARGRE